VEVLDARDLLKSVPAFASLPEDTLSALAMMAVPRNYTRGAHLVLQGASSGHVFLIVQGNVRVYRVSREGREQVLGWLTSGDMLGLVACFGSPMERSPSHAVAASPVVALVFSCEEFQRVLRRHGDLTFALLHSLADRLKHMSDLVEDLALFSVQQRLAHFLLVHAPEPGASRASTPVWTQSEIAAHLGTVREMVSRGLRSLEALGAVRVERGRIVLLSREKLEAAAR